MSPANDVLHKSSIMYSRHPTKLVVIGLISTFYGVVLIKRGIEGDTLMPGTSFTYLPRWLFIMGGALMQLPLIGAVWFMKYSGYW